MKVLPWKLDWEKSGNSNMKVNHEVKDEKISSIRLGKYMTTQVCNLS